MATQRAAFAMLIEGELGDELLDESIELLQVSARSLVKAVNEYNDSQHDGHTVHAEFTEWVSE
jgi:hypothetical protein